MVAVVFSYDMGKQGSETDSDEYIDVNAMQIGNKKDVNGQIATQTALRSSKMNQKQAKKQKEKRKRKK